MVYIVDVLGFSIMGNHFYLLIEMSPGDMRVDDEVRRRFILLEMRARYDEEYVAGFYTASFLERRSPFLAC